MSPQRVRWAKESCDRDRDPASGALNVQLTSAAACSINIYLEQPYTCPDGRRVAIVRRADPSFDDSWRLLVADLPGKKLALIERDGVVGTYNAAWSGQLHYVMRDNTLYRLDLQTLETTHIPLNDPPRLAGRAGSVSPDQRHLICRYHAPGEDPGIVRVDLTTGDWKVIYQHPELTNPHIQFNPVHGRDIVVQHNRGSRMDEQGRPDLRPTEEGVTHFLIDIDGNNERRLPVGPPHTASSTGHSNFIADTGRITWTVHWNAGTDGSLDKRYPQGNLFTVGENDAEPTVFHAPEHRFIHVNASRCGRYFVADSAGPTAHDERGRRWPFAIVVGNYATGRYRTLVTDAMSSGGNGQHNHVHPYLTADNGHVIYNANPYYSPTQVFAAEVSKGFLASLD